MDFANVFNIRRAGLFINFKSTVSSSDNSFGNGNPWIVMAEDSGIFFVSWRVGRNFTKVQVISGVSRLVKHNTIFGVQALFYRIKSFFCQAFFYTNAGNDTEALRLNENLPLFAFVGANLLRGGVISTKEPFSIPASVKDCLVHFFNSFLCDSSVLFFSNTSADLCKLISVFYIHTCNKYRFCNWSLRWSCGLEGFTRLIGKAVQVQTVVPVSTSDERKLVWSKMGAAVFEGTAEMLKKRSCFFHMAVKSNHFIQNGIISSFL